MLHNEAYCSYMPHANTTTSKRRQKSGLSRSSTNPRIETGPRYSVGLPPNVASQVERYAETADTSTSKAIAALVRLGLDSQETRKREFFKRLRENLGNDDPKQQDRMVDEFRTLILGR